MKLKTLSLVLYRIYIYLEYLFEVLQNKLFGWGDLEEELVTGKVAIITGGNSGIGKQVAKELADRGATVIIACRNVIAGREVMNEIKSTVTLASVEVIHIDLADLVSVRKFAEEVKSRYPAIHLLINNAGVGSYNRDLQKTKQDFELHMGVNHLSHFLLTNLLLDNLKAGAPSRVVTVASACMLASNLRLDDLMMEHFKRPTVFTGITRLPYNNSKMANALFNKELGRRLEGTGVTTYALCPGLVKTNVFRDCPEYDMRRIKLLITLGAVSIERGATGVLYCAVSRKCEHETGKFYRFGQLFRRANRKLSIKDAEELWRISERLVELPNLR